MKTKINKFTAVQLGRFAPYHKGHQKITELMLREFGIENTLIMIGSSNVLNERTPFSYNFRKKLIKEVFPDIKIIPLPDINPTIEQFENKTIDAWLAQIKKIEKELATHFIFVGGSESDLSYLEGFKRKVLVDRSEGGDISATLVRNFLKLRDYSKLKTLVNPKVAEILISNNIY